MGVGCKATVDGYTDFIFVNRFGNVQHQGKYSREQVPEQYRHITNEEKRAMTSHRYGDITGRYVIYRGDSAEVDGVQYLNVEEYLKLL